MRTLNDDEFVQLLTACQLRLLAYIVSLVHDTDAAQDVLQETNAELWGKRAEFRPESEFGAWASRIAHFKVLSHFRDRSRERLVFDADLLADLAVRAEAQTAELDETGRWLEDCLSELPEARRTAILDRYRPGNSVNALAQAEKKSAGAMSKALARTRALLLACLRRKKQEARSR
jgi:RNA polymerase sigma-70 factor (ECF subfamily)